MKGYHKRDKGIGITFDETFIVEGVRTGFGKYCGTIAKVSPTDLGIFVAKGAMEKAGIKPDEIDQVVFSNITQSSTDAYYLPRHVGLYSGIPFQVPALLVQRLCGTGFEVVITAAEQIGMGKAEMVLAGASENMSLSPTVSYGARMGYPMGRVSFQDFLSESLKDSATGGHMGCTAENLARDFKITRTDVDEFSILSNERAINAESKLSEEMTPVFSTVFEIENLNSRKVKLPRGIDQFATDEHIRLSKMESLKKLPAVFEKEGVHTAANSSGVVDGAAAMVIASGTAAKNGNHKPIAKILASASAGVAPDRMGIGPVPAIEIVLELMEMQLEDIGLIEVNEAFAGQLIAVERALGLDREKLNVNGGAIALGHPLSATGSRLILTLAKEMQRRNVKYGIASACIGGGQGTAVLLENPNAS